MKSADNEHKESLQAQENLRQIEKMREASNLSAEQLLALKDGSLSEAAEVAKALSGADEARAAAAAAEKSKVEQMNLVEKMMERQDRKDREAQERMDAKDERSQAVLEQALRSQQAVTEQAISGASAGRDQALTAYQTGADQAKEMANRSMDTMQNVAAAAATAGTPKIIHTGESVPAGQVINMVGAVTDVGRGKSTDGAPKVAKCEKCGDLLSLGANNCIGCGHRV
jgi:hypothetical protein